MLPPQLVLVGLQQHRGCRGALHVAAYLNELPAFAVAHGGVGDALELVDGLHDLREKLGGCLVGAQQGFGVHVRLHLRPRHLKIQRV